MKIGIMGTGNMGRALGLRWARIGHDVFFGSRDRARAEAVAAEGGKKARGGNFDEAAAFGEVVLDFTEAILQDRHVVVTVYALFGRVRLIVPAGVEVIMNGNNILGRQRGGTAKRVPTSSEVPVIEVRGHVAASEVLARTPPRPRRWLPGRRKSLS